MNIRKISLIIMINIIVLTFFTIPKNVEAAPKMPKGSTIASVSVTGKTDQEVKKALDEAIAVWQTGEDIQLSSDFEQFVIPRDAFVFDVEQTVKQLNERTKRTLSSFFMRQKNVHLPLHVEMNENHEAIQALRALDYIQQEETIKSLISVVSELEGAIADITYKDGQEVPLERIAEIELNIPSKLSEAVLTHMANEIQTYIVAPEDHFSLLEAIDLPKSLTASADELSFMGTALYTLFLQTNFEIVERHAQLTQSSYAEPGLDVAISEKENKDLIVINPNKVSYKIETKKQGATLHAALYASPSDLTYKYELENKSEIKQRTLYRYSKKLKAGEEQTIQAGRKGLKVEVHRSTFEKNVFTGSELISHDIYLPEPTIILVSTATVIPDEDLVDEKDTNVEDDLDELAERIDELDENAQMDEEIPEFSIEDPNMPTIADQLQKIRQLQNELEEKITLLEKEAVTNTEDMKKYQKEVEERFNKMSEQIEELLEFFLSVFKEGQ